MSSSVQLASYVGGAWREGDLTLEDINPARPRDVVASVLAADAALAEKGVAAAEEAFIAWRNAPAPARGEVLRRAADVLEAKTEQVARDLAQEEGKTIGEAVGETARAVAILRYYAGQTLEPDGEVYPSHSARTFLYARREPVGVVSAITPWNFPIAIPAWKIAPALAYGNTVVWKPAELVPLTSVHLVRAFVAAGLPAGVLNLVLGRSSDVGDVLVSGEGIAAVTFTGSNDVGRAIQLKATKCHKKVQLELGGKNPAIVLADADVEHAAEQVSRGAFLSAGQKCTATSRVIVQRRVLDQFAESLVSRAKSWRVGDPLDPATKVGPVASSAQLARVSGYLDDARSEGASLLAGDGALPEEGYFVAPTVLANVAAESAVAREEVFGPVATLLPVDSYEEAIALANDTPFGLTASLFTRDLGRALSFAREIRAGVVKVNQETAGLELQAPFGGTKASSSGSREQGKVAREFFTEWKTVYVDVPEDES
jgi:alpha-ketoglutaric semialdehyde dehydrogenase